MILRITRTSPVALYNFFYPTMTERKFVVRVHCGSEVTCSSEKSQQEFGKSGCFSHSHIFCFSQFGFIKPICCTGWTMTGGWRRSTWTTPPGTRCWTSRWSRCSPSTERWGPSRTSPTGPRTLWPTRWTQVSESRMENLLAAWLCPLCWCPLNKPSKKKVDDATWIL